MTCSRTRSIFILFAIVLFASPRLFGQDESKSVPDTSPVRAVEIAFPSSVDDAVQKAVFHAAKTTVAMPLVVSLHSWSGDHSQDDPLAEKVIAAGWNYIHPDFRGRNNKPDACLSDKVIADIDDAIQYALDNGPADRDAVFVVGGSGGGHATLGVYLRTRHRIRLFLSWVPISDLTAWYWESKSRANKYADDIVLCTSTTGTFEEQGALERSPLYWPVPKDIKGRLEIYAGINDGYTGSVPVSHTLRFYNKMAEHFGRPDAQVSEADMIRLLARGVAPNPALGHIEDRPVLYRKEMPQVAVAIFEGGHELLVDHCLSRMRAEAEKNTP